MCTGTVGWGCPIISQPGPGSHPTSGTLTDGHLPPLSPVPASSAGLGALPGSWVLGVPPRLGVSPQGGGCLQGSGCPLRVLGVPRAVGVPSGWWVPVPPAPLTVSHQGGAAGVAVQPWARRALTALSCSGSGDTSSAPPDLPPFCPHCPCCLQGLCLTHQSGQSQCILPSPPFPSPSLHLGQLHAVPLTLASLSQRCPLSQPDHRWDPSPLPFYTVFVHMTSTWKTRAELGKKLLKML